MSLNDGREIDMIVDRKQIASYIRVAKRQTNPFYAGEWSSMTYSLIDQYGDDKTTKQGNYCIGRVVMKWHRRLVPS